MGDTVENVIEEGLFHLYVRPEEESVEIDDKTYDVETLIPRVKTVSEFEDLLGSFPRLNLSGLTTDQQLYRPEDTIHVMVASLGNGDATVTLEIKRNGVAWLEDRVTLDHHGLALYKLHGADLGTYEITGTVNAQEESFSLGSITFDVAAFQLDPFTVEVINQSISSRQVLTAEIKASILGHPYSGTMKVGLYCSFCKEVVLADEITCIEGKGVVSFDVGGHTAPFSLEFVVPDQGYTARVQLEGTRPEERRPIPLSRNLNVNYSMLLFPQAGSIDVQGVNVIIGDKNSESPFHVPSIVNSEVSIQLVKDLKVLGIITYHPVSKELDHVIFENPQKGTSSKIVLKDPHVIVLLSGVTTDGELFEAFFIALKPADDFPEMKVPESAEAGKNIIIEINNPKNTEVECLLLVHDQRKTHKSFYKVLGKQVHEFLSRFSELNRKLVQHQESLHYESRMPYAPAPRRLMERRKMKRYRSPPKMELMRAAALPEPMMEEAELSVGTANIMSDVDGMVLDLAADATASLDSLSDGSLGLTDIDILENYPEVLYCDLIRLQPQEQKKIEIELGDQVTTWVCRLYSFEELLFTENVQRVEARRVRHVEIRAPSIIDADSGDEAEVEIRCLSDVTGQLAVYFNESAVISNQKINPGMSSFTVNVKSDGVIRAVLKTEKGIVETEREILKPFAQTLVYWHLVHLFPDESFDPPQPVTVFPSPLFLLEESTMALLQYPYGCAEQTSSKTGALAIVYKYLHALGDAGLPDALELMKSGLARLHDVFYDSEKGLFGLWSKDGAKPSVTRQVLKNLAPLREIWDDVDLPESFRKMIEHATRSLLQKGVTSFDLLPHSPDFRPRGDISDVKDAALALVHDEDASEEQKNQWFAVIQKEAKESSEECWWLSPKAWGGKLETTAIVLRAITKHVNELGDDFKLLYKKGLTFLTKNMINGRLFTTSDTFALINLFADAPSVNPTLELSSGETITITTKTTVDVPFITKNHAFITWTEERLANPFESMPKNTLPIKVNLQDESLHVGERTKLVITVTDEEAFCPVLAICLPPHLALLRGGGNVQQHYIAFEGDDTLILDIVAIREGKGHVRIVVHEMYDPEKACSFEPLPIMIT